MEYAGQIARGLAAAHEKGIVHRDLKPENVFLTRDGQLKILDFGLAKLTHSQTKGSRTADSDSQSETIAGMLLGTVGYMAPEQARGEAVDHRADLFSFGAILYEMLCGQRAFQGTSDVETLNAIVKEEPPDLVGPNPQIPTALQRILRHCLEKSPQQRYHSASDMAFDLEVIWESGIKVPEPETLRFKPRERLGWMAMTLLLVGLLASGISYLRRTATDEPAVHSSIAPPEGTTLAPTWAPAISPDGRLLAFVGINSSGKPQLYLRPLASPAAEALPGTEEASQPFWSPDSRLLAYFAQGKLRTVPIAGGPPQVLCDVQTQIWGATWSREQQILYSTTYDFYRIPATGGQPSVVSTHVPGADLESSQEAARVHPHFLPDGRHFLFTVPSPRPDIRGIYVGNLESEQTRRLLDVQSNAAYVPSGYLLFVRDWTLMAQPFNADLLELTGEPFSLATQVTFISAFVRGIFSVSAGGVLTYVQSGNLRQLVWFDRRGRKLDTVGTPEAWGSFALSPDEKRIAVTNYDPKTGAPDIWLLDVARGIPSRFTFDPAWDDGPIWAPDGSRIVFSSTRNGSWDLFQKATSGDPQEEALLISSESKFASDWSRDGRFISYYSLNRSSGYHLWILSLFGHRQPMALTDERFHHVRGFFAPDSRWIAYKSTESGRGEVYLQAFPVAHGKRQVSTEGGEEPRWRADGKELFYLASDGKLMAVKIQTKEGLQVGEPEFLFRTQIGGFELRRYDVSADGQRFLFAIPSPEASSLTITLVLNWPAILKNRASP